MKIQPTAVDITLSPDEARILIAFVSCAHEEDPPGAASERLGIHVGVVCQTMQRLEMGLKETVGWMRE